MIQPPRNPYQGGIVRPTVPPDVAHHGVTTPGRRYGPVGAPGGGPMPGLPSAPGPGGAPGQLIAFPPEVFPPEGAQYFTADASAPALTSINTPVVLTPAFAGAIGLGLQVQVPANSLAVVRGVTILVNGMTLSTDIRWRLKANGAPLSGWDKTISPRIAGSVEVSFLADFTVVTMPGDGPLIELEIQVNDAGVYQAGGTFDGWFWPTAGV